MPLSSEERPESSAVGSLAPLVGRGLLGGVLMGLANLVPGISGGTMLLAAGVYPNFIQAISELTRLTFRARSMALLGAVGVSALTAIVLFAGVVKTLVIDHRWAMYSLFIGLTLGGVPVRRKLIPKMTTEVWAGVIGGFAGMSVLAIVQAMGSDGGAGADGPLLLFIAGIAGASAMILPGVSGGYLLLVLGAYVPILSGIHAFKEALKAADSAALADPLLSVVLPVGIGVVVGIAGVSNLLGWFLRRFEQATYGLLLGLLLGAVVGLWPFQRGVEPQLGDTVKGRPVTEDRVIDAEDWPTAYFAPAPAQVGGSLALIVLGVGLTLGVGAVGAAREDDKVAPLGGDDG